MGSIGEVLGPIVTSMNDNGQKVINALIALSGGTPGAGK
ncbi:hypothetical protein ABIC28_002342 [Rhodococcus sp. PvR044]|jgi:hypothetical protein|nr:hypothetical protein BTZ20_4527 [Rhodococcus sp. MTM3W5.2]MBP1160182.1 hypothetical protein [Rhodococcus sp. PvR099]PTR42765.1 hypothetical protein C8K38_11062 [Rhodococcus sp. OK611]SNX91878.1 hypothetical protein SAMN05447004_111165 [Rhodococcus sp. OK270]